MIYNNRAGDGVTITPPAFNVSRETMTMRKFLIAGAMALGLAGIGHNMPPASYAPQTASTHQAVMPKRTTDENRRNNKLKQKLRRGTEWGGRYHRNTRFMRKMMQKGTFYHPGKLFKGHRI
jgi:hypothetical protein